MKSLIGASTIVDSEMDIDDVCALMSRQLDGRSGRDLNGIVSRAVQNAATTTIAGKHPASEMRLTRELLLAEVTPKSHPDQTPGEPLVGPKAQG